MMNKRFRFPKIDPDNFEMPEPDDDHDDEDIREKASLCIRAILIGIVLGLALIYILENFVELDFTLLAAWGNALIVIALLMFFRRTPKK